MRVVFFDELDVGATYRQCVAHVGDKDYCAKVVEVLGEVAVRREFVYGGKVRFKTVLQGGWRHLAVSLDGRRRAVVAFLDLGISTAALFYERSGDGFRLKFVDWITPETRALLNPHPAKFFREE